MPVGAAPSMSDAVRPSSLFSFLWLGRHGARDRVDCGEVFEFEGAQEAVGEERVEHTVDDDDIAPQACFGLAATAYTVRN